MRILIIEDEPKIAEVISSRLKKENYVVDINKNGEEGLDNALTNIYDLIILDVMLPKINGFEILKQIGKEKSLSWRERCRSDTLERRLNLEEWKHDQW